jgi:hypothetical protein
MNRYTPWNIIQPQKEWNPVISDNTDGSGAHYFKQNKPGTERQVVNDLTHMWNLQKVISEVQGKMVCTFPYFLTSTNARENLASYHP